MRIARTRAALLKTSGLADVKRGGVNINITGLEPIFQPDMIKITHYRYRAEVSKVETIGASYTPTANTSYILTIGDFSSRDGFPNSATPKKYVYRTPSDLSTIGTTAASQREAINAALVAKINVDASNNTLAVSLGTGTGFTITDDAGYFPAKTAGGTSGRQGKTLIRLIKDTDGRGFVDATDRILTTDAIYSFGVGARLLQDAPIVLASRGGAVVAGTIDAPVAIDGTYAVTGQQYDAFGIDSLILSDIPTIGEVQGYRLQSQLVFVDNGRGSATTNAAGFTTFERQMHKIMFSLYREDPKTVYEFFDEPFIIQAALGAVPATTGANKFMTPYGALVHNNIGINAIVAPVLGNLGMLIEQTLTAGNGAAYTPGLTTLCDKQIVVGNTPGGMIFKISATAVANAYIKAGWRVKAAHTADFNDYTALAAGGTQSTGTTLYTYGILADAATVSTSTGVSAVNSTEIEIRVNIDLAGIVSIYINNVKYPVYSAGTTPLVLAAGTIMIPFFEFTNVGGSAAAPSAYEFVAVADDKWKIDA